MIGSESGIRFATPSHLATSLSESMMGEEGVCSYVQRLYVTVKNEAGMLFRGDGPATKRTFLFQALGCLE